MIEVRLFELSILALMKLTINISCKAVLIFGYIVDISCRIAFAGEKSKYLVKILNELNIVFLKHLIVCEYGELPGTGGYPLCWLLSLVCLTLLAI